MKISIYISQFVTEFHSTPYSVITIEFFYSSGVKTRNVEEWLLQITTVSLVEMKRMTSFVIETSTMLFGSLKK